MNNMNFDEKTMNNLKNMMDKGDLNDVISQIPPDMMKNFSSMMSNSNTKDNSDSNEKKNNNQNNSNNNTDNNDTTNNSNNFDFSQIDMKTFLKMKSAMDKMNNTSNNPRANLLHSLKPYLRDEKKGKIDQYASLLNFANITEIFKNDNKENKDG